ncbi:hypothetical protein [Microbacterium sp. A93]|uniref:hypothetical protein n=1 Tax=Microbacterium sp. A93 TaxID=3450716 RepID=UPI003F43B542
MVAYEASIGRPRSTDELRAQAACTAVMHAIITCTDGIDGHSSLDRMNLLTDDTKMISEGVRHREVVREVAGKAAVFAMLEARNEKTMSRGYKHLTTNIRFELVDATNATIASTRSIYEMSAVDPLRLFAIEQVSQEFRLEDGNWKVCSTRVARIAGEVALSS